jgi:hypothetical protein
MTHLVIGMGEVGSAVYTTLYKYNDVQTLDITGLQEIELPIDVLHICIPHSKQFIAIVKDYIKQYSPKATIVYSTVPIGTCEAIGSQVAHSPVEGKHPRLADSMARFTRWIGCRNSATRRLVKEIWENIVDCKLVDSSRYTEALKLCSTSKYGINLVWADYTANLAKDLGMDYEFFKEFDEDYNRLYTKLHFPNFRKFVLDAPEGKIGGHCVVPNAELLDRQYPSKMLKMIKEME